VKNWEEEKEEEKSFFPNEKRRVFPFGKQGERARSP